MKRERCQAIFERFKKNNPHPTTELKFASTFELLIAVILSAQATDTSVNRATYELYKTANSAKKILALGENQLKNYIRNIGLYNTKAKHIIKACQILLDQYNGQVPDTREALEALPGVGRKTANVILNTSFGHPTIAVDTHIFRVANRTGLASGRTPLSVEKKLLSIIPKPFRTNAHHWLLLHGRYVCTARQPKCAHCFIEDLCQYPLKNMKP